MENNYSETEFCGYKKGIHDLKGLFAFRWIETGIDYGTNSIEEYKDPESRLSFVFDCEMTESAIAEEIEKRKAWNENYIKELKEQGKFGEEYCITIRWVHNPEFDGPIDPPKLEPLKTNYNWKEVTWGEFNTFLLGYRKPNFYTGVFNKVWIDNETSEEIAKTLHTFKKTKYFIKEKGQ